MRGQGGGGRGIYFTNVSKAKYFNDILSSNAYSYSWNELTTRYLNEVRGVKIY